MFEVSERLVTVAIQSRIAVVVTEIVLALSVVALLGGAIYAATVPFAPEQRLETQGADRPASVADHTVLTHFDPFGRGENVPIAEASSEIGLALFGIRLEGRDGGSAIIGIEGGRQGAYASGDEVVDGVYLKSVAADGVILEGERGLMRLVLAEFGPAQTRPAPPPPALPSARTERDPVPEPSTARPDPVAIDAENLLAGAYLRPRVREGEITGYALHARGAGEALRAAGLAAGDVVVALNGSRVSAEILGDLERGFASGNPVQLTVERGSATRMITLQTIPQE